MANVSVTNTFTNATTADATQVNTNFTDIINGTSDGTKDFSISALTCAGTFTANGHVNLGNASADDLTITASLASTLPVKTNTTYSIGSATLGLLGVFIGGTSTFTANLVAATHAASRVYTLPDAGAAANVVLSEGTATINGTKTFAGQLIGKGTATNDNAAAGYTGEYFENINTGSANNMPATTVVGIDQDITLGAGDWHIFYSLYVDRNSATVTNPPEAWFSATSGNSTTGRLPGSNVSTGESNSPAGGFWTLNCGPVRVSLSGSTQYFLKGRISFSAGTPKYNHRISARRVR